MNDYTNGDLWSQELSVMLTKAAEKQTKILLDKMDAVRAEMKEELQCAFASIEAKFNAEFPPLSPPPAWATADIDDEQV